MQPIRSIAAVVALLLVTAACGTGTAETTTTTTTGTTGTGATTTTTGVDSTTTTIPVTATTTMSEDCSASGMEDAAGAAGDLPPAVAETRLAIIEAALACDYEELAAIAGGETGEFTYSFGGGDDPAGFWREAEDRGDPVMKTLVMVLEMSHRRLETESGTGDPMVLHTWPGAFGDDATEAQWDEVKAIYSDADIASMREFGGYIGYRVGITDAGDWRFLVAGD